MAKEMNIFQKVMMVRLDWLNANVQKTGINRFAEYQYFELEDIVPVIMPIMSSYDLLPLFDFSEEYASLTIVDMDLGGLDTVAPSTIKFHSPMRTLSVKGMNDIQALGAVETYQRRYLYMMFLDIVEQEQFDKTQGQPEEKPATEPSKTTVATPKVKPKTNRPATDKERSDVKKELTNSSGEASKMQVDSIKTGLKKLRELDKEEEFITEVILSIKAGITKTEAEDTLIAIGKKIEEE